MHLTKRVWAEIDIEALKNNYDKICSKCGVRLIPAVKADAYGHGAVSVASALQSFGNDFYAVACLAEAIELRENGIKGDILILGYTPEEDVEYLIEYDITQTIYSEEYADIIGNKAKSLGSKVKSHLKLDTGMGRIGFDCREEKFDLSGVINALNKENLDFVGVFTHFSVADSDSESDIQFTRKQFGNFCRVISILEEKGYSFKIKHCCNSAGLCDFDDMYMDAVRPGIILYGINPSDDIEENYDFQPVMSVYAKVSMVKEISDGEAVSYGRTYKADKKRKIASVNAGYADGVPRLLSNNGFVFIGGKRVPIVGRVCMDQFCIDVTELDEVKIGDTVEIFGKNISVSEVAKRAQTIGYEIVCGISKRVPRIIINERQ